MRRRRRRLRILAAAVFLLGAAVALCSAADEPLRRELERRMNASLQGYTVTLGWAGFQPLGLAVEVESLVIRQDAHPEPPVANIGRMRASVQWLKLVRGAVVADLEIERPALNLDRTHVVREVSDGRPIRERGWQDALQAMYPLRINELRVVDGSVTYLDEGPFEPLRITQLALRAANIRNIEVADQAYPSEITLVGVVFDRGRLRLSGNANFLGKPHPGVRAAVAIDDLTLGYLKPIADRYNLAVTQGTVSAVGVFEHRPGHTSVDLERADLADVRADYIHTAPTAQREEQRARKTVAVAKRALNEPALELHIERLRMRDSQLGFVNRAAKPEYRVFLSDTRLSVDNLSNRFEAGASRVRVDGRFMGSGDTRVNAVFKPEVRGPDFGVDVQIRDTDMRKLNPLLRAYGSLDVVRGFFSIYSELSIQGGRIDGYVKPLFRDVDVYSLKQDSGKNPLSQLYEGLAGGVAGLLKNSPREEVATKTDLSGPLDDPETSTWQVVVRLVQNAFFKAILPGLDRERRRGTS